MKRSLKSAIEAGEFILAPGLHDMIIVERRGRARNAKRQQRRT